jgi:hypothetical protein
MTKYNLNKLKLAILLYFVFGVLYFSYSQSKKDQIELLTLKYDSLSSANEAQRNLFIKEKESLNLFIQNIRLENESFSEKNEQLNKQIQQYKSEIEILKNEVKKLSDSISRYTNFQILSFWILEEIEIIAGPVMQVDYAVLQISDKTIKGFVGWASQGESDFYISGDLINGSFIGDVFYIGCEEDCTTPSGNFQLKIENLKLKLSGAARVDHDEIPSYNGKHFFNGESLTDLLIEPKIGSKVLMSNIINNDEMGVEIIEIGNYEKINGEYNLWYKVKINDKIGWVFGGLCTVCPNSAE